MLKTLRKEIHEIKWLDKKDVLQQTLFVFGVVVASASIFMIFETGVQMLLGFVIK